MITPILSSACSAAASAAAAAVVCVANADGELPEIIKLIILLDIALLPFVYIANMLIELIGAYRDKKREEK